ncbi:family 43 glycosylhydrolase [Sphingobacterium oryzagri]|uniref:Family 43 glycosylhydrolase n=1 Tax=Sphingobacterium oryzagri TaxID=3025669 RepID=A0ABY7WBP2_9SPHI|nr:family 43 glycosylhydrolase [Sphingobacterium sp. KACC 22765]WDF67053.1 family 43 glycosylhydrolase [Sphingobacterium sp. KACC 22765]
MRVLSNYFLLLVSIFLSDKMYAQNSGKVNIADFLIPQRADPFIAMDRLGNYYFIATVPEFDRLEVRKAQSIDDLPAASPKVIWRKHRDGIMGSNIWAPELYQIEGKWYIYFAAGNADEPFKIRKYVLSNTSEDPTQGDWVEEGELISEGASFSLDATLFQHNGKRFMIWADKYTQTEHATGLYIAEMQSPTQLKSPQVLISKPTFHWETNGFKVNEGPAVLIRNGKVFIAYSASATDASYCIGLLQADTHSNLLEAKSWRKSAQPVFYTNEKLERFGPGHNSFFRTPSGEDYMVYHARDYRELQGDALTDPNRHTRMRKIMWTSEGLPDFGQDYSDLEFGRRN